MLNLRTRRAKINYQREHVRLMLKLEKVFVYIFKPILYKQFTNIANKKTFSDTNINDAIKKETNKLKSELTKQYKRTGIAFSNRVFNEIFKKEYNNFIVKDILKDDAESIFLKVLNKFIKRYVVKKVLQYNKTTKNVIKKIIENGLKNNLTNKEIAKTLKTKGNIISTYRATRIAKTETHSASTFATDESIKATGLVSTKEWVAALDERTRESHVAANGQIKNINETFLVGGEELDIPGDPNGSAENVINCRCVAIYNTK